MIKEDFGIRLRIDYVKERLSTLRVFLAGMLAFLGTYIIRFDSVIAGFNKYFFSSNNTILSAICFVIMAIAMMTIICIFYHKAIRKHERKISTISHFMSTNSVSR